ncbi:MULTISPECIES: hypothetical protein [Streptomyces]|nr:MULTISPECIES: hypothetical protein [Streptomyces]MDI5908655.1 hypothetical protein [Streptomyces sp. 12257]
MSTVTPAAAARVDVTETPPSENRARRQGQVFICGRFVLPAG